MMLVLSPFSTVLITGARLAAGVLLLAALGVVSTRLTAGQTGTRVVVYVGTYTGGASRGIYRFELDSSSGATTAPELAAEATNPSFLALRQDGRVLYAVNEVANFGGANTGAVSAFAVDPATGRLSFLNQQPTGGADPCHLAVDGPGRHILVANYSSGTVAALPIAADGRLSPASSVRSHTGRGPNGDRQQGPHAHAVAFDPSGRYVFESNLGTDRIYAFRFDAATGRLEPHDPADTALAPGAGPRHLAWHPSGRVLYSVNELNSTVTAFRFDLAHGSLAADQTAPTLPVGFTGQNTAAEIAVLQNGRFLYASNRGHDSLAVFAIDPATGTLTSAGYVPTGGKTPRHFAIDPANRWLLAANQSSGSITIFRLDAATGHLSEAGRVAVPDPVCLLLSQAVS